ncbi:hypothetical protein HHK36_006215 [Tetracentron sinense]|uniref:GATA transcription factor n=1 Tax=Tetracentron sinense TaxID=13715 RepID=A0A834ZGS7_TETSI|nr:hypothetical protein HHK36_006215 [Tetracentron sinense]
MDAPDFFPGGYFLTGNHHFTPEKRLSDPKPVDHFIIEDLLDFSNEDAVITDGTFDNITGNSTDSSTVTVVDSCNSSFSGNEPHFPGALDCHNFDDTQFSSELCVPHDDLADLEWITNFTEESFTIEDLEKLQLISGMKARRDESSETRDFQPETNHKNPILWTEMSVPGKARSKRSRAAPCNWSSRLLVLSPTTSSSESYVTSNSRKKEAFNNVTGNVDGRRCRHCDSDKTPQWRTGPLGPKTLCNACGVRYKSGRLVPEYRPASSPTFVVTKHSNSHRKVIELRRQKEQQQFLNPDNVFGVSNGDDYSIHHHTGPDFQHLMI